MLKFFLDEGGFPFEAYFHDEAEDVNEEMDPETFEVLEASRFRKLVPKKTPREHEEDLASSDPAVIFDKGGRFPIPW